MMAKITREPYSSKLQSNLIKLLKHQAVEEDRYTNELLEDAIRNYLIKKGVDCKNV